MNELKESEDIVEVSVVVNKRLSSMIYCWDCGNPLDSVTDGIICRLCWSKNNRSISLEHLDYLNKKK